VKKRGKTKMSNEKVSVSLSKKELEKSIVDVAGNEVKRLLDQMIDKIAKQYDDLAKDKTENEMSKVNGMIKQKYPEKGTLVLTLSSGDIELPFDADSKISIKINPNTNLEQERKYDASLISENELMELCSFIENSGNDSYAIIETESSYDFEMYDEEYFEKEKKPKVINKRYSRIYKGMFNVSYFKGIHSLYAKITDRK
jgi:hypothetical protein